MMFTTGTIRPDGTMHFDGYVPSKWRLLAISPTTIAIHSPGATWYDNGGSNYGRASIETYPLAELQRGNEENSWRVRIGSRSRGYRTDPISFHPTPKEACREAMQHLMNYGDELIAKIEKIEEGDV